MLLEPTALATAFRYLADSLEQDYGKDPAPLFAAAGVPLEKIRQPGARVPQKATRRLWALSVDATGDPAIGLRVGPRFRPESLHALGYAWMSSGTLADALHRFARYARVLVTIPVNVGVTDSRAGYHFTAEFPDPAQQPHEAAIETTFIALLALASQSAGKPVRPRAVTFQHACQASAALYSAAFGVPVEFGAGTNGLVIDGAVAEAPLRTDNPDVAAAVEQVAERYIEGLEPQPVAATVREVLRVLLPTGEAGQETVAKRLNRSLSTLQRQLQAEGLTYRTVLDATRRTLADAYLGERRFSQAEIAYLLGFSDQSNFSRAYRRWTGRSPGRYGDDQDQ